MSLMKTLAKVAIGIAVAKGVGAVIQNAKAAGGAAPGGAGRGGPFGGPQSPGGRGAGGGLEDMMSDILAGKGGASQGGTSPGRSGLDGKGGGLGDLLDELGGAGGGVSGGVSGGGTTAGRASAPGPGGGGLDDLIGQLGQSGGLGELLGGLLGGAVAGGAGGALAQGRTSAPERGTITPNRPAAQSGGSAGNPKFRDTLNQSFGKRGEPDVPPTPAQDAVAGLLLRAMIMAAKSDGQIDANEQKKLMDQLGDVSADEKRFVEAELAGPVDPQGLARQVPPGLGPQVYAVSLLAIDLDSKAEAQYLDTLARALGVDPRQANAIHDKLGVTRLYS